MAESRAMELDPADVEALEVPAVAALEMDEDAFRLFYQRTSRPLWAYLSRVSRNRQHADDLLQETYCRFLRSRRPFESDDHRRHYLFRIATNLLLDGRRRPTLETAGLPEEHEPGAAAVAVNAGQGTQVELSSAMARLSPRDRALLWLAYAQGASHREIAAETGLTSGSVKQLLFRARRRLARILGGGR